MDVAGWFGRLLKHPWWRFENPEEDGEEVDK
jgi:hypothetical protein